MASGWLEHSFRLGNDARTVTVGVGILVFPASFMLPGPAPAAIAVTAFAILSALLLLGATRFGALRPFGAANAVTTVRVGLLALLIGSAADAAVTLATWWPAALAGVALALDGLDGALARRLGTESRFGALFDQETDALLILVLTVALALAGKTGIWIVAAGLMRYLLLASGWIWPVLAEPLPKSRLRSGVCAVMVGSLVLCLLPPVAPATANVFGAIALTALTLSFGKDLIWLLKSARGRKHA
ncbi:MAG: CDP-alcohol phosphatidyltransferase family protein [Rhodospirillaceae bacterium]|nr:CDP-alcohol phosphatidyltransferase family protein [Rhodospirillaceae bacterium]MDD9918591.1 CDP-alcohol phosphatidyltransferase family protein [Rhodospirillaceae bacterium]MDD9928991.1 CDP-alcohol phosphatidyltransferase family protein [Rhodospirillaceae bacterium]